MKKFTLLALTLLTLSTSGALADNFNVTNVIMPATAIVGFPTNTIGTNGIGTLTGGAVGIPNGNFCTIDVQGLPLPLGALYAGGALSATNTAILTVQMVRSTAANAPGVANSTNAWYGNTNATAANIAQSDWETTPPGGPFTFSISVTGSNAFNFMTNWIDPQIAGVSYVGCYSISNAVGTGTNTLWITNFVLTCNKKIIPTRYP